MSTRDFALLICSEVFPTTLLLVCFWAWSRRREPRKLSELAPVSTACVDFFAIAVDPSGKTYIDLDSRVYEEPHSHMLTVKEMDGGYVISIPEHPRDPILFTPRRLLTSIANYALVIQIAKDNDRFRNC
jgi:hypothetical protein